MPPKASELQEERSSTTRRALLEATVDCLVEEGYANLTTTKVAARAQVSRGAQVHHFPTKATLVSEAIQYLIAQVSQSLFSELGQLPPGRQRSDAAMDLLWDTYAAGSSNHPHFEDALHTTINAMTGLAVVQRVAKLSKAEVAGRWRRTKAQLLRDQAPTIPRPLPTLARESDLNSCNPAPDGELRSFRSTSVRHSVKMPRVR